MKIYAALKNDISSAHVWIGKPKLPTRGIVKITLKYNDYTRTVFCEALQFEENFLNTYNQGDRFKITSPESSIVMSYWYRAKLGEQKALETQEDYPLEVDPANCLYGKIRVCTGHPQIIVRIAVWLGIWSVILGSLGVGLGIVSLLN